MTTPPARLPIAAVPTLDAIADGQALDGLPPAAVAGLAERAEVAAARLRVRLLTFGVAGAPQHDGSPSHGLRQAPAEPDRLLTPEEAAQALGVTVRWLYRHAPTLPFARRLSRWPGDTAARTCSRSKRGILVGGLRPPLLGAVKNGA